MEKTFTEADIKFINERGNSPEKVQQQLDFFIKGIPKINLVKSATIGDGIWRFSEEEILPLLSKRIRLDVKRAREALKEKDQKDTQLE